MKPHEQRVVDELEARRGELSRLESFVGSETFNAMHRTDRDLLLEQVGHMRQLASVLHRRIERFKTL